MFLVFPSFSPSLVSLSLRSSVSRNFFFSSSLLPLSPADSLLAPSREHNYRLRVPSQWMVNGEPRPLTYHHKPLVTPNLGEVVPRYIRALFEDADTSFYISLLKRQFNYICWFLICGFIVIT